MVYCSSCGREVPLDATFCPHCGAATNVSARGAQYEVDRLVSDARTQEFWFKRVVACVIDFVIVGVGSIILSLIALLSLGIASGLIFSNPARFFVPTGFGVLGFGFSAFFAVLALLYFTLSDLMYQRTFGKSFMGLKVVTTDGSRLDIGKALIRNVSKIYWLLLLLDLLGGFFSRVQSGQKFSDHIANTNVVPSR
jgi:uncharacterized RDD family membrane protein YckC